ncbi:hypothetical protein [Actinacidiphila bryophytorum]|uniref:hypothetical protein n=1 Tax=Actinacidiphila bryophytorum TaxID=1436133 RepID=UPI002176CBB7|nr:hypothetical protein [Actinacidiphila bryophytorum]UWE08195.1 hypothetical protein NYE86_05265 [Actinacidiphila bryophytorum]
MTGGWTKMSVSVLGSAQAIRPLHRWADSIRSGRLARTWPHTSSSLPLSLSAAGRSKGAAISGSTQAQLAPPADQWDSGATCDMTARSERRKSCGARW